MKRFLTIILYLAVIIFFGIKFYKSIAMNSSTLKNVAYDPDIQKPTETKIEENESDLDDILIVDLSNDTTKVIVPEKETLENSRTKDGKDDEETEREDIEQREETTESEKIDEKETRTENREKEETTERETVAQKETTTEKQEKNIEKREETTKGEKIAQKETTIEQQEEKKETEESTVKETDANYKKVLLDKSNIKNAVLFKEILLFDNRFSCEVRKTNNKYYLDIYFNKETLVTDVAKNNSVVCIPYYGQHRFYCIKKNSELVLGWTKDERDSKYYYFENEHQGSIGQKVFGWRKIGGKYYYFDDDGSLQERGMTKDGYEIVNIDDTKKEK